MPSFSSLPRAVTLALATFGTVLVPGPLSARAQAIPHPRGAVVSRVLPPAPGRPSLGFWHTSGSAILDSQNRPVHIAGLNWSGLETTQAVPGGLQHRDYRDLLRSVAAAGFNTVRLPFSNQMVETPIQPENIGFHGPHGSINQDLLGLTSLQIMDRIIAAAGDAGLRVILDNHRSEAGSSAESNGLWYTAAYPEQRWLADWTALAARYRNNPTVVGFDLRNEPHNATTTGACWGCNGPRDWRLAAERAGNAILRVNPNLLILVEGTDTVDGETYWWGGNLSGVRFAPVRLALPHHLVYSTHTYGPAEYQQPWFNSFTTPATLAARWQQRWGFLVESNIAPVFLGEFGATSDVSSLQASTPGSESQWFHALTSYLAAHPSIGWTYWGLNGEDRYGLLDANYSFSGTNRERLAALASLLPAPTVLAARPAPTVPPSRPATPLTASATAPAHSTSPALPVHAAAAHRPHPLPAGSTTPVEEAASSVRLATARALLQLEGQ